MMDVEYSGINDYTNIMQHDTHVRSACIAKTTSRRFGISRLSSISPLNFSKHRFKITKDP